jgi:hypothetical protein
MLISPMLFIFSWTAPPSAIWLSSKRFCDMCGHPVPGSSHHFKYRLALIVNGECVMRYDNERGKGDHRHLGDLEEPIEFTTLEALFDGFQADMERILA